MAIKNWQRIANHNKANEIITKSYDHALSQNLSWPSDVKSMESFISPGHDMTYT